MDDKVAISVKNLHKDFVLPHDNVNSLKDVILHPLKKRTSENQHVLRGISFDVKKGEFFGVVGRNGSGKSTLLKILAGTYQPTKGEAAVNGSLVPFIELGVGFNPELSGRDNVYLNGALLGFSRKEMSKMYDDIVRFAELERFMDQKVKNYSSGMQVRLAFSIAIKVETDVLLVDEVLAVGDANFQSKCYEYFHKLKKDKKTVVFISHDMNAVQQYCDRAIIIDRGKIVKEGNPKTIAQNYTEINMQNSQDELKSRNKANKNDIKRWGNGDADILSVYTGYKDKKLSTFTPSNESIEICIEFKANKDLKTPTVGCAFSNSEGKLVFATNTEMLEQKLPDVTSGLTYIAKFTIDNILTDGRYTISCAVANADRSQPFSRVEDIFEFQVGGRVIKHAQLHPKTSFDITKEAKA